MAKIKVDPGVYLPSNPDGVVVDINRTSGRPLQSHAKAPFMATFKVRRERHVQDEPADLESQDAVLERNEDAGGPEQAKGQTKTYDTWQSAIFKVGDDCRQDVLALQIIAMHKNIFTSLGLDLLVTPYKVTATGPGVSRERSRDADFYRVLTFLYSAVSLMLFRTPRLVTRWVEPRSTTSRASS